MSSAIADASIARKFAGAIEDAEARRLGVPVGKARAYVARRVGASPGTLENIRRSRLKQIPNWLMVRIRCVFVEILQAEIAKLEHEIAIAKQTGVDYRDDVLDQAQGHVAAVKTLLKSSG